MLTNISTHTHSNKCLQRVVSDFLLSDKCACIRLWVKVLVFLRKGCIILWYNSWPHFRRYSWVNRDRYSYTSTTRYSKYWIMLVANHWEHRIMNKYTWTYTVSSQCFSFLFHFSKNIKSSFSQQNVHRSTCYESIGLEWSSYRESTSLSF